MPMNHHHILLWVSIILSSTININAVADDTENNKKKLKKNRNPHGRLNNSTDRASESKPSKTLRTLMIPSFLPTSWPTYTPTSSKNDETGEHKQPEFITASTPDLTIKPTPSLHNSLQQYQVDINITLDFPSPSPVTLNANTPVTNDDFAITPINTDAVIHVLNNDIPAPNESLKLIGIIENGLFGDCDVLETNVVYVPDMGFVGEDSCIYEACDTLDSCSTSDIFIKVTSVQTTITPSSSNTQMPSPFSISTEMPTKSPVAGTAPPSLLPTKNYKTSEPTRLTTMVPTSKKTPTPRIKTTPVPTFITPSSLFPTEGTPLPVKVFSETPTYVPTNDVSIKPSPKLTSSLKPYFDDYLPHSEGYKLPSNSHDSYYESKDNGYNTGDTHTEFDWFGTSNNIDDGYQYDEESKGSKCDGGEESNSNGDSEKESKSDGSKGSKSGGSKGSKKDQSKGSKSDDSAGSKSSKSKSSTREDVVEFHEDYHWDGGEHRR